MSAPTLPEGLVVVVKEQSATCRLVAPLLPEIAAADSLTVYTQDDPSFPGTVGSSHDHDLAVSWHHEIETVPTLIRVSNGKEVDRTVGWLRDDWRRLTGLPELGEELPAMRPGCGSLSVDPDRVDALRARFSGDILRSRRIELADRDDEIEMLFDRGVTDGLPVVPPTEERVLRMLTGTSRAPGEVVAVVPPDLVEITIEKIAINAVMAGCKPEYLPWVIAALEAVCTDEFNMHGVLATTMPVGPVIVCNGPGTRAIGMNSGVNVLGQGNRANSTIGRAVQLIVRNVGGGRPGEVDRAAHGNPGKVGFCFPEDEEHSPWTSLAVSRGYAATDNTVTVFAGEGPRFVGGQLERDPEHRIEGLAASLRTLNGPQAAMLFDALLVVGPEHTHAFAEAGWDRERVLRELHDRLQIPARKVVRSADGAAEASGAPTTVPQFRPGGILLVHAGGGAGLFSALISSWLNGPRGSMPVTRLVTP